MQRIVDGWLMKKMYELKPEDNFDYSDRGTGQLFATVFKDLCRYNVTAREWYTYSKGRWKQDTGGMLTSRYAKSLSDAMTIYCTHIKDERTRKTFSDLCTKLGQRRYRVTMIEDARDFHFFSSSDLDKDLFLLNCLNGVLNLRTFEFTEHSPDYLMSKQANVIYDPNASGKEWRKFINEALENNQNKIRYLQKLYGCSMTGETKEESCWLLYGASTRNGKSTAVETYAYMLGNTDGYALNMRPETLAQKANTDSRQATGDIARLDGCRFLNASEPPKKMVFDVALLKTLLGRDSITARHLHQSEFQFIPVFKLFINTNFLPVITDSTLFSSGRLNVITFERHFKPEEQDKGLKDRLKEPENLSGLLNWCIEGLKAYYAEGAIPPPEVVNATKQYEEDSDKVGSFIAECLVESDKNSKAKDIYNRYSEWCRDNGFGTENKTNFFAELKSKGIFSATGTVNGKTCKNVVRNYVIDDWQDVNNKTPFD